MAATAQWLLRQYKTKAAAVAGSIRRILTAESNDAEAFREELRRYCFAYDTTAAYDATGAYDAIESAKNEGRRQVMLHFMAVMNVAEEELKPRKENEDGRDDRRSGDDNPGNPRYPDSGVHVDGNPERDSADAGDTSSTSTSE